MEHLEAKLETGSPIRNSGVRRAGAFTLVELILIMALLVIAVSLVMPTLSKFFGGRALDSEVKRFMALMHYGQTRAVADGVPMVLWIDPTHESYGLRQDSSFGNDANAVQSALPRGLSISTERNTAKAAVANSQTGRILNGQVVTRRNALAAINFEPDGTINPATSAAGVLIEDDQGAAVWIGPSDDSDFTYVAQTASPNQRRR